MSQKRMFDRAIIDTDRFMDLPMSTKGLYFLMGMEADDEGFVSPKKVMRVHGGNEDELKVLCAKKFVIPFKSGVVVITDWNKNNWLDTRRIRPTEYQTEKKMLTLTEEKTYVLSTSLADAKPEEYRIEEKSIEQNILEAKASHQEKNSKEKKVSKNSDTSSSTPFSSKDWIESLVNSEQDHIALIGAYFQKYAKLNLPTKEVATTEMKKNLKPSVYLVKNFTREEITKTLRHCQDSFPAFSWNLATVQKQIVHVTKKY